MRKKTRLIVRYSVLGALVVGGSLAGALALLDRDDRIDDEGGLVAGLTDAYARGIPGNAPALRFTEVPLEGSHVHFPGPRTHRLPEDMGSGVAMEDFDGDGRLDLFFVNLRPLGSAGGPASTCAAYRNLGDFRFERVQAEFPDLMGMGVAAADYDADGDFDLLVTGYGRLVLLRNDGDWRFVDVTRESGLKATGFFAGACWGDVDQDGDLDLYVCRYVEFDESVTSSASQRGSHSLPASLNPSAFEAQPNLLFLNEQGRFGNDVAEEYGVSNPTGKSLAAVFADFDKDGLLDLYVANDVSDNALFRGRRGAPFEDATHPSNTADWRGAMGLAVGDPDGDGDLDLFITHWVTEENTLYVNVGPGLLFRDNSETTRLGRPGRGLVGWACDFVDLDNDGRADLYAVNGSTFEEKGSPLLLERSSPQIFWNAGKRYFDLAPRAGPALQVPFVGRGGTSGDLDGDGDCDLVFVRHGETPLVLRNDIENPGNFLVVEARGSMPNPFAYGALVTVEAGGRTQVQQVGSKVSYLSSGPHRMHFGLGSASQADKVIVRFPSGRTVTRTRVLAGRRLVVKEVDPRGLGTLMDKARDAGPEEAIRVYREILDLDPAHENVLYALAQLVEPEEAIRLCDRVIAVAPRVPRGYLLRARLRSDPSNPALLDLEHALADVERARRYNRDETGGALQAGRIRILAGDYRAAAEILTRVQSNPRAAALGALARLRLGETEAAEALLARHGGRKADEPAEEGDSPGKRMGERDLLARLLELPASDTWEMSPLPDDGEVAPPAPPAAAPVTPYDFDEAAAWALDPPDRCEQAPPGATSTLEADVDGDGDLDLIVVCGADDPAAPLPWWALLREGDSYRPVRGTLPAKGWGVGAIAAVDIDQDGRSELILQTGGMLASDRGDCWIASLKKTP